MSCYCTSFSTCFDCRELEAQKRELEKKIELNQLKRLERATRPSSLLDDIFGEPRRETVVEHHYVTRPVYEPDPLATLVGVGVVGLGSVIVGAVAKHKEKKRHAKK